MNEPAESAAPLTCPMCGKTVTPMENLCPGCGESIQKAKPSDVARDRLLCYLVGGFTGLMTGGMLINCVMLQFEVIRLWYEVSVPIAMDNRDTMTVIMFFVSVWLWGVPLLRVVTHDPTSYGKENVPSRWRIFWRTQSALSLAVVLVCLITWAAS